MLRDKSDYFEIRHGEGYDEGVIIGCTEALVCVYRRAINMKKKAHQLKCKTESDEQKKQETLASIERLFEHINFKDDMDRFIQKYPRRSDYQLAKKICAESEYRYVINRWIKIKQPKEEKQTDE